MTTTLPPEQAFYVANADLLAAGLTMTQEAQWRHECEEYEKIAAELMSARGAGVPVYANEVFDELVKRLEARGEKPLFSQRRLRVVK